MTGLQQKIISIFKQKDTYDLWGFSVYTTFEVANLLKISHRAAQNSMEALFKKGVFYDKRGGSMYSFYSYYLKNENFQK